MQYGFLKACAATATVTVANPIKNAERIIIAVKEADKSGVKLLVFPELCLSGATCGDLFFQKTLLESTENAFRFLLQETSETEVLTVLGLPVIIEGKLFNAAAVFQKGKLLGLVAKHTLSLKEKRYFTQAPSHAQFVCWENAEIPFSTSLIFSHENMPQCRIGVVVGEDFNEIVPHSTLLASMGATVIVNPSAEPETVGKAEKRSVAISALSRKLLCGYIYSNAGEGESTTDFVFAGHRIIAEEGKILAESELFSHEPLISEPDLDKLEIARRKEQFPVEQSALEIPFSQTVTQTTLTRAFQKNPFVPEDAETLTKRCEQILTMQAYGLKKRLLHSHSRSAVIGISGGLDSCLALLVMAKAADLLGWDRKQLIAVTMPCFGTTRRTKTNAQLMSEALGTTFLTVDISDSVRQHFRDISHEEENHNVVYENAQARERTQVLMDIANQHAGMVIGTGDLSELALGWATYNGDHMSMYAVNSGIPKTLIRHIVRTQAEKNQNTPLSEALFDILDTPVSPELLPAVDGEISQKTEELVGPYEIHDFYLYYALHYGFSPKKILYLANRILDFSEETLLYWLKNFYRRFFAQQFKRSCLPDGVKIGSVGVSPRGDLCLPSDADSELWLSLLED